MCDHANDGRAGACQLGRDVYDGGTGSCSSGMFVPPHFDRKRTQTGISSSSGGRRSSGFTYVVVWSPPHVGEHLPQFCVLIRRLAKDISCARVKSMEQEHAASVGELCLLAKPCRGERAISEQSCQSTWACFLSSSAACADSVFAQISDADKLLTLCRVRLREVKCSNKTWKSEVGMRHQHTLHDETRFKSARMDSTTT